MYIRDPARERCPICGFRSCACGGPYTGRVMHLEREGPLVGEITVTENVYGEDAAGKRRLLHVAGDRISEEEAERLGLTEAAPKARRKTADKASSPTEDKGA